MLKHPHISFSRTNSPSLDYDGDSLEVYSKLLTPFRFPWKPQRVKFSFERENILDEDYDNYDPFQHHIRPFLDFMRTFNEFTLNLSQGPIPTVTWSGHTFSCTVNERRWDTAISQPLRAIMFGLNIQGGIRQPNVDVLTKDHGKYVPDEHPRWILSTRPVTVPPGIRLAIVSEDIIYKIAGLIEVMLALRAPVHRRGSRLPPELVRSVMNLLQ
jgi:hypothetical protein